MNIIKDKIDINPELALMMLNSATSNIGVLIDLDRVIDISTAAIEAMKPYMRIIRDVSDGRITSVDSREFYRLYTEDLAIPSSLLMSGMKPSTDKNVRKAVLASEEVSKEAKSVVAAHSAAASLNTIYKAMKSYIELPLITERSFEGNRIVQAKPKYRLLSTWRLQASAPNIQNLTRTFPDIITTTEDYEIIRCDSAQIEPKIMWSYFLQDPLVYNLILLYKDAYFGLLHFVEMTPAEEQRARADLSSLVKKAYSSENRSAFKLGALAAGYGSNLVGRDVPYANLYVERINNHPARKRWEAEILESIRNGEDTFYTAFGLPIKPDETDKYKKGTVGWANHLLRCGINNPIQGTASQLMFVSLSKAYEMLENSRSNILMYKHDEGAFYVHKTERHFLDDLKGITAYDVTIDGKRWLPIESDCLIGVKEGNNFGKGNMKETMDFIGHNKFLATYYGENPDVQAYLNMMEEPGFIDSLEDL